MEENHETHMIGPVHERTQHVGQNFPNEAGNATLHHNSLKLEHNLDTCGGFVSPN